MNREAEPSVILKIQYLQLFCADSWLKIPPLFKVFQDTVCEILTIICCKGVEYSFLPS